MASALRTYAPDPTLWQRALNGDRDAFEQAIEPLNEDLLRAARHQVQLQRRLGQLRPDALTPEELMGEGLLAAFRTRSRFDSETMRFRSWLLGLQHRAFARLLRQEQRYTARKAISLDAEVPENDESSDAVEEALYEFHLPYDVTTYAELIPGSTPADIEIELDDEGHIPDRLTDAERIYLENHDLDLGETPHQVVLFHDEFALTLPEVAQILDYSLKDTAEALGLARTSLREQIGSAAVPPDPDDAIDSYTGDPVR